MYETAAGMTLGGTITFEQVVNLFNLPIRSKNLSKHVYSVNRRLMIACGRCLKSVAKKGYVVEEVDREVLEHPVFQGILRDGTTDELLLRFCWAFRNRGPSELAVFLPDMGYQTLSGRSKKLGFKRRQGPSQPTEPSIIEGPCAECGQIRSHEKVDEEGVCQSCLERGNEAGRYDALLAKERRARERRKARDPHRWQGLKRPYLRTRANYPIGVKRA